MVCLEGLVDEGLAQRGGHVGGGGGGLEILGELVEFVGESDDVDDAVVAACAGAGCEFVCRVAGENNTAVPAPMLNGALLKTNQTRVLFLRIRFSQSKFPTGSQRQMPPALDKRILISLRMPSPLLCRLRKPLIDGNNTRTHTRKQLRRGPRPVSLAGLAGLEIRRDARGETDPESAVGGQERFLFVDVGGVGAEGEGAHEFADHAVGAVGADDEGPVVGGAVGAGDEDAVLGAGDVGNFFVGDDFGVGSGGKAFEEYVCEVMAADDSREVAKAENTH